MADKHSHLPMNAMMGWTESVEAKNDAIELAKGFITRRYTAVEASWYAVAPFMGGYLWEVHEGGPGKGYVGSVINALTENPGNTFWFPSGDRVFQVMMRDGKPFGVLLSKNESLAVLNSDQPPLIATTRMKPAVRKGTVTFVAGAVSMGAGVAFMAGSMIFYAISANPGPSVPAVDFAKMPHAQWPLVANTDVSSVVSKLQLTGGQWKIEKREHEIPGLKIIEAEREQVIEKIKQEITPLPNAEGEDNSSPMGIPGFEDMSPAEKREALRERARARQQNAQQGGGE